ncbi:hypothetical protein SAMN04487969_13314 [Paenibacillus algorifonticola]|uniref:Uncharacterized protein n=1 Tax=Paenibacillus algorifonticola TaxID=684063 RepID=A0A1I2ID07_9BACL|nr:hypothetical protein [Paenibacillus algorifonticola]SFF39510.1 hypothetical protein SAMN04487969_13314 [Paenibacillus algorifonticola]
MKTYEQFVGEIIAAAQAAELHIYQNKNRLETRSLDREFSFFCTPRAHQQPYQTSAYMYFEWSSVLTAESLREREETSLHPVLGVMRNADDGAVNEEPCTQLHIQYEFEVAENFQTKTDEINQQLLTIFRKSMGHTNVPVIKWELIIQASGENHISKISAQQHWSIPLLSDSGVGPIMAEVNDVLIAISELPFIKKDAQ